MSHRPPHIDIIVPVHDALEYARLCLESVVRHADSFDLGLIVVDDGSAPETAAALAAFCTAGSARTLIRHDQNIGYTRAINSGLQASRAPFVVLLNSDTIVTPGWLHGMMRCMTSAPGIGIVGPLSNAAGWQNVPYLLDENGNFAANDLPAGISLNAMASLVASASNRLYPRLPAVNGFCMMISRPVIDHVGCMDDETFPIGYGEETDYCLRTTRQGFEIAVADDAYVFHAKSRSFGHRRRHELSAAGDLALRRKHTPEHIDTLLRTLSGTTALERIRTTVLRKLSPVAPAAIDDLCRIDGVLFLLPVGAGGGGGHSVVQEAVAMRALGINAQVAVINVNRPLFMLTYADEPNAEAIIVGYHSDEHFVAMASAFRVVVATINSSVRLVEQACRIYPHLLPAYYIQDYEPFFFEPGSADWKIAIESYTLISDATLFAKTWWLVDEVASRHAVTVHKVLPSIDHEIYRPGRKPLNGRIRVAAMIRPDSPRRGAARTMRVLQHLARQYHDCCRIHIFGCSNDDQAFQALELHFKFHNHGVLSRHQVASLLGKCDVFVNLSDYQAFGRTGIEAMASTCAAVLPAQGGIAEYAIDGENALIVDSLDEKQCIERIGTLLADPASLRTMQENARQTALRFSATTAALSELRLFSEQIDKRHLPTKSALKRHFYSLRHKIWRKLKTDDRPHG